jgi:sterol desaturase/sphingolipid hydroxylase (fatty acid hydroxylase superfamily)
VTTPGRPRRDLTVLATPFYFVAMAVETVALQRRRASRGPTAGDYDTKDTAASLLMGQLSLVLPLITRRLARPLVLGEGRLARRLLGAVGASATVTTLADARRRRTPHSTPSRADAVAGAGAVATVALGGLALTSWWSSVLTPHRLHRHALWGDLGDGWLPLGVAMVGWDLIYYWNHRFMHSSRYMWAMHVVHHSSEHYNLSTALRQPVAESLTTPLPYGLICLLGVPPTTVETARGVNLLYQFWVHTEAVDSLGRAEGVLNSPSAHRVHHGSNSPYLDRNHGGILIVWDRLFGTFEPEGERVVYGLTKNIHSFNPLVIIFHEYLAMARDVARAPGWRARLSHVVRGPGWRGPVAPLSSGAAPQRRSIGATSESSTPEIQFA